MGRLRERIADERLLGLIDSFLKAGIFDGLEEWEPAARGHTRGGAHPSNNLAKNPHWGPVKRAGHYLVNYADGLFANLDLLYQRSQDVPTSVPVGVL